MSSRIFFKLRNQKKQGEVHFALKPAAQQGPMMHCTWRTFRCLWSSKHHWSLPHAALMFRKTVWGDREACTPEAGATARESLKSSALAWRRHCVACARDMSEKRGEINDMLGWGVRRSTLASFGRFGPTVALLVLHAFQAAQAFTVFRRDSFHRIFFCLSCCSGRMSCASWIPGTCVCLVQRMLLRANSHRVVLRSATWGAEQCLRSQICVGTERSGGMPQ